MVGPNPDPALEAMAARYLPHLRHTLSPLRLEHSLSVAEAMRGLVPIYGLDARRAYAAALLHDLAKDRSDADLLSLAAQAGLAFGHPSERHPVYLHAPVGAYLAQRDLGVFDAQILDAIASHSHVTYGVHGDGTLAWCLRFADVLAPTHPWPGEEKLRGVVLAGRMQEAQLLLMAWLTEWLAWHDAPVHPQVVARRDALARALQPSDGFYAREVAR